MNHGLVAGFVSASISRAATATSKADDWKITRAGGLSGIRDRRDGYNSWHIFRHGLTVRRFTVETNQENTL